MAAAAGPPGQVATLILPADVSWLDGADAGPAASPRRHVGRWPARRWQDAARRTAERRAGRAVPGGSALRERGLVAAARVAGATGAKLLAETFPARLERGAGLPAVDRLGYLAEFAAMQLDGLAHLVLVDAKSPVSFFAYPGKASDLVPDGCQVHVLAAGSDDAVAALEALADAVDAPLGGATLAPAERPDRPTGDLDAEAVGQALGALLPEDAIVADEGQTARACSPRAPPPARPATTGSP